MKAKFRLQLVIAVTVLLSAVASLVYAGPPQALVQNSNVLIWAIGVMATAFGSVNVFLGFFLRRYVTQNDMLIKKLFEHRETDHDSITTLTTQFKCLVGRKRPCENCDALTRGEVKEIVQDVS